MQKKTHFTRKKHYPWVVISLCAFFLFYKYILQTYPGLITHDLQREFKLSGAGLGNLAAAAFYSYTIMQLFVGVLLDRFGTRTLASLALLVSSVGLIWFSFADTLTNAVIARLLMGFGIAFATVSYMKMAAVWFPANQFAFVAGLLATAAMIGAIFGQAPLALMFAKHGWRASLFDWGIIGLAFAVLYLLVLRDKVHAPEYLELPEKTAPQNYWHNTKLVFTKKQNWLLTAYSGLAFSPIIVFAGLWGHPFLQQAYHLKSTEVATLTTLSFAGLAFGGPLLGLIADRFMSKRRVMMYGSIASLISLLLVIYVPHLPLVILAILMFLFGLGTGAFMLSFALGRLSNPVTAAATVIALINTGDALFGAFTEPMVGKLLDLGWAGKIVNGAPFFSVNDYQHAMFTLPIYLLLALILLIWIKEK